LARVSGRLAAMLKTIHETILAAKTRRVRRQLMFRADWGDDAPGRPLDEQEIRKIPQRPMILGDKWDF
jgi:hypothetical protein